MRTNTSLDLRRKTVGAIITAYRRVPGRHVVQRPLMRALGRYAAGGGRPQRIAQLDGFRMHIDLAEMIESRIYYTGSWEPGTIDVLNSLVQPGDTVVDVGAHVGFVALSLGRMVGPAGRVLAFEPSPWAHERLLANLALNDMGWIHATRVAVGERQGQERITLPFGYMLDGIATGKECDVDITTIDAALGKLEIAHVDALKIDTDGFEPQVLRGARLTITRDRPRLLFELTPRGLRRVGNTVEVLLAELDHLRPLGYGFFAEGDLRTPIDVGRAAARIPETQSVNLIGIASVSA